MDVEKNINTLNKLVLILDKRISFLETILKIGALWFVGYLFIKWFGY